MNMRIMCGIYTVCALLLGVPTALAQSNPLLGQQTANPLIAAADPFVGSFANAQLNVTLQKAQAGYAGHIEFGGQTFPLKAAVEQGELVGSFEASGTQFEFKATLKDDELTFATGGTTYVLRRQQPEAEAPATPAAPSPAPTAPGQQPGSLAALANLGPVQQDRTREWTVVIYLDGDNDLEMFALRDLNEMEKGLPAQGVEVIVLLDRAAEFDDTDGDWTSTRVYRVKSDADPRRIASPILCDAGELNLGDPEVLATFVGAALRTFPARNHMLILWDHGGGWASMSSDHDAPGSPEGYDHLTLAEMAAGVRAGLNNAGLDKLEIIGFDMCLMAQLETAVELRGTADVLIASQAIEPGDGWPFDAFLPVIGRGTLGARRIAQEIVRLYGEYYTAKGSTVATLSAMDMSLVDEVAGAFDELIGTLTPTIDAHWPSLSRCVFYSEAYSDRTDIRTGKGALASVDLLDMVKRMRHELPNFPAEEAYRRLVQIMDRFVIASHTSPLRRLSNGVAIYAPVHSDMLDPAYTTTALGASGTWVSFLTKMHASQRAHLQEPQFTNIRLTDQTGKPIAAAEAVSDHRLSFTLTGQNIVWTQVWWGKKDEGTGTINVIGKGFVVDPNYWKLRTEAYADEIDLVMPKFIDGENHLYQDVSCLTLLVTDGQQAYPATIDGSSLDDREHISVPIVYEHPSVGRIGGTILFDAYWWQAVALIGEIPQPDGRVMMRQMEPNPDADVTLLYETINAQGETGYAPSGQIKWGRGPELLMDVVEPGEYEAAFIAETIGGATGVGVASFTVQKWPWIDQAKGELAQFGPREMLGTWDHIFLAGGKEHPSGYVLEISPHPEDPDLVVAKVTSTKDPDFRATWVLWPDTRLTPSLRFWHYDDAGNLVGWEAAFLVYGKDREGRPIFLMKMLHVGRETIRWVRRGGATTQQPGQPGQQPGQQPAATDPLAGLWTGQASEEIMDGSGEVFTYPIAFEFAPAKNGRYTAQAVARVDLPVDEWGNTIEVMFQEIFEGQIEGGQLVMEGRDKVLIVVETGEQLAMPGDRLVFRNEGGDLVGRITDDEGSVTEIHLKRKE
ncbi:MAG: hypothetical protein KAS72_02255 [Phycisphaerales bacterium]|nr:hypothetical protein [Phycisphaerales bacterium]